MKMGSPNAKALIYVLTFLSYSFSCDGSEVLNNLKDAVTSAKHVFRNLIGEVTKVNKLKEIHDVLSKAALKDCKFTCPTKGFMITPNQNHTPSSDGCGSLGVKIDTKHLPVEAMTRCCDTHDLCYDACNAGKERCDFNFKQCLYNLCDTTEQSAKGFVPIGCKAGANILFTGVQVLGCKSYLDAQKAACCCTPYAKKKYQAGGQWGNFVSWSHPFSFHKRPSPF